MATFNLWVKGKERRTRCRQHCRCNRVKLQNSSEQQERVWSIGLLGHRQYKQHVLFLFVYKDLFSLPSFLKWRWGCYQTSLLDCVLYAGKWNFLVSMSSFTLFIHFLGCLHCSLLLLTEQCNIFCWQPVTSHPWKHVRTMSTFVPLF